MMKFIESIIRRILFSFGVAVLFTIKFNQSINAIEQIAIITWIITGLLFLLSWRLEREFTQLFIKETEKDTSLWGTFEREHPWAAYLLWQSIVTIAAIHITYLSLDYLHIIEVNGERLKLFIFAFGVNAVFRLLDQHTYRKK